jgi:plasmid stabilization system protein ParE
MDSEDEFKRKPAILTPECFEMLYEAEMFIAKDSQRQAKLMDDKFYKILGILEKMPGIGARYVKGMRRFLLGKFPYYIYYREHNEYISIRGIWHTSRGTDFVEPEETGFLLS